jgi:hypothetical protein
MKPFHLEIKLGSLLYLMIFVLALTLRFIHLGAFPLGDEEALSALRSAEGTSYESLFYSEPPNSEGQPSYEIMTRVGFQIFGTNNFLARFIPALAGGMLILTPLLAKKRLGWGQAGLMSFLLAVCPVFVTISRTASGVSLSALGAMSFVMAGLGLEEDNKWRNLIIAGVGLGLCLASGPYIFNALLTLGLTLLIWKLLGFQSHVRTHLDFISWENLRHILWISGVSLLVFVTGVGLSMNGISEVFDSISMWLKSWNISSPFTIAILLVMIPTYMPVLSLLGIFGGWIGIRRPDKRAILTLLLTIIGLVILVLYPGHQPIDLIWIALPLSFLGSGYLAHFAQDIFERKMNPWVVAISLVIVLVAFMTYMQISSFTWQNQIIDPLIVWITILGFLALVVVILSFFGLGWDWTSARLSLILASLSLAIFISISALWRLNFRSNVLTATELWRNKAPSAGLKIMTDTIETISQSATGTDHGLNIEIIGTAPPSMMWALRDFQPVAGLTLGEGGSSPVILAPQSESDLLLQEDYLGQTIAIGEEWDWSSAFPPDFLRWWVKQQLPIDQDEWLILIRQDIVFLNTN